MAPNSSKHATQFKEKHILEFGLKITARNPNNSTITTVACLFCITFGKEQKDSAARKQTVNVKYWKEGTFRSDYYSSHLVTQHPQKWAEYQNIKDNEDRKNFFVSTIPFLNTLHAHGIESKNVLTFQVKIPIVEKIIGKMLFHPDDVEGASHTKSMEIFKLSENGLFYTIEVNKPKQFKLSIKLLAIGTSFRALSKSIQVITEETGIGHFGGCSEAIISMYVRIVCAVSLQNISEILESVWASSLAFDVSTHQGHSYLDLRVRFCLNGKLENLHLIALPMYERHTGESMFNLIVEFLDVFYMDWKLRVIGLTSDGDRSMTGKVKGVITRLQQILGPGTIRVWCGLHQLDLVMRAVFETSLNEKFLDKLTTLIGYLRRQYNLIQEMNATCPKYSNVRWLSMGTVLNWLQKNQEPVENYLVLKKVDWAPSKSWWLFLHILNVLVQEANNTFRDLQALVTHLAEQHAKLKSLCCIYQNMAVIEVLEEGTAFPEDSFSKGKFFIQKTSIYDFIENISRWAMETLEDLSLLDLKNLVEETGKILVHLVDGISNISAERNASNDPSEELPPVLPHQLIKLNMRQFVEILKRYDGNLEKSKTKESISKIDEEFSKLKSQYKNDADTKSLLDKADDTISFETAWKPFVKKFPNLTDFCGGIASAFPNTATVESDFSRIGIEKTEYRKALTNLSLEGLLHCKQFYEILKLVSK